MHACQYVGIFWDRSTRFKAYTSTEAVLVSYGHTQTPANNFHTDSYCVKHLLSWSPASPTTCLYNLLTGIGHDTILFVDPMTRLVPFLPSIHLDAFNNSELRRTANVARRTAIYYYNFTAEMNI